MTGSPLCKLCCAALSIALGSNKIVRPGTAAYNTTLTSYFTPQVSAVHPQCFVTPESVDDVSCAVETLAASKCEFAVRGGGHQWFPGAASDDNVVIDLRGLHSVSLSNDKASVTVGGGATWDLVYAVLDPLDLTVAGGRVAGVGVGGLTTGGGISYLGPQQGWTCDTVNSFQVVLASGSVVTASEKENSDLFLSLRGGSNNFGIVTSFNYQTFKQGLLWSDLTANPLTVVDQQAQVYADLANPAHYDEYASFLFGWSFDSTVGLSVCLNQLVYTHPTNGNATPSFYEPVIALPSIDLSDGGAVVANMSTLAAEGVLLQPSQVARYLSTEVTWYITADMILATFDAWNASLPSVQDIPGIRWDLNIEVIPPQMFARDAHGNALGLTGPTDKSLAVCLLAPAWSDAADDETVYAASKALMSTINSKAEKMGLAIPYIYMNYAAPWQNVIASYGQSSVAQLEKTRARVDPKEVFTYLVPGGFKLP